MKIQSEAPLNEYEAACFIGLSPTLLRWLTKYAPKFSDGRKLKYVKKEDELYFFARSELRAFNDWLKVPWPSKNGERPHIPEGIRKEIRAEANGECAVCQGHKDTCEAAHLVPVAKGKNNHPENLVWLCNNHHKSFDDGSFGLDDENAEFVASFKRALHAHKRMLWRLFAKATDKVYVASENCGRIAEERELAKTPTQILAVEKLGARALLQLRELELEISTGPNYIAYQAASAEVKSRKVSTIGDSVIAVALREAQEIGRKYVENLGWVECPLCEGKGRFEGEDCPACGGDGEMPESQAERVDLRDYDRVPCPLCEGSGSFRANDCPGCGGEGDMLGFQAERLDLREYEQVKCPLCEGTGRHNSEDCPVCGGEGDI